MNRTTTLMAGLLAVSWAAAQSPVPAASTMPALCTACHKLEPQQIGGYYESAAFKSQSMQIDIGGTAPQILRFDTKALKVIDDGKDKPAEFLRDARKRHEVIVDVVEKDGVRTATAIRFKGPVQIDAKNLIDYAGVARLVEGAGAVPYTLIDSRPLLRFQEGAIPTAIHLPFIGFDKFADRLPADKNRLVVFYCGGITCTLSPNSMKKAQRLGYTQLRVYREGQPEWSTRNHLVTTPAFVKAAYVERDIPHVLVDARSADEAAASRLPGAVSLPAGQAAAQRGALPPAAQKAPLIVYDGRGGEQATAVAKALVQAGQQNVMVLAGGMLAWQAAGYPVVSGGPVPKKIAYAPKPRAGSLPMTEFTTLAKATPTDTLILDVRNPDEAAQGMIKGAVLIPDEELQARLAELPRDKRIVAHCLTGIRAEMAYHKLKAAGFNAAFLNNEIEVRKDGSFKITPR